MVRKGCGRLQKIGNCWFVGKKELRAELLWKIWRIQTPSRLPITLWLMDWASNQHLRGWQNPYWISIDKYSPNSTRPRIFVRLRNSGSRYPTMLLKLLDWTTRIAIRYGPMPFERRWSMYDQRLKRRPVLSKKHCLARDCQVTRRSRVIWYSMLKWLYQEGQVVAGGHLTGPPESITYELRRSINGVRDFIPLSVRNIFYIRTVCSLRIIFSRKTDDCCVNA